jgi:hypothetical protein
MRAGFLATHHQHARIGPSPGPPNGFLLRENAQGKRIIRSAQLVALTSVHRSMSMTLRHHAGDPMPDQFACPTCASPAVTLPDELVPDAAVRCRNCDRFVSTWLEFKCRTTAVIMAQHATARAPHFLSCDPLFVAEGGHER